MKKHFLPQYIWVQRYRIEGTKRSSLCLTTARIWGCGILANSDKDGEFIRYKLALPTKKKRLKP